MNTPHTRMIFVNLCVRDLEKSKAFFAALGFGFNLKFTDQNAACLVISETIYAMLIVPTFFKTFTKKEICDTSTHTEALICLSCGSRAEVDEMVAKALAAGGTAAMPAQDHGFMYGSSFYDLDGHHWEVMWMDPATAAG
ncbi:MAG: VOC family protein [Byssovorax sp.]